MEESLKNYESEYHFIFKTLYDFVERTKDLNSGDLDISIEMCYNYANMSRKLLEIFTSIYSRDSNLKEKIKTTFSDVIIEEDRELVYKFVNNFSHNNSIDSIKPQNMSIYLKSLPSII